MPPGEPANWGECSTKLDHVLEEVSEVKQELRRLNGTVRDHDRVLAVLCDWRQSQVQPTMTRNSAQVQDLRTEMAKLAALGGGVGAMVVVIELILKALGVGI